MRFRCERDVLGDALATSTRALSTRPGPGGLTGALHLQLDSERLEVCGSDSELSIRCVLEVNGSSDGGAVIPGRLVQDIVRSLPLGAVDFETGDDEARISGGRSYFTVRTGSEGDFLFPTVPDGAIAEFENEEFASAIRQVIRAASSDSERPSLTGVLMAAEEEGLRLVATDSYRLAIRDLPGTKVLEPGVKVLLPARALSELQRVLGGRSNTKVNVVVGELETSFEVGDVRLVTTLLRTDFPNYSPLIPKSYPNRLVVDRESVLDALRRVRLLVKDITSSVRASMKESGLELVASAPDVGQVVEEVDGEYAGVESTLAFNPNFLIDGIEAVQGEEVVIETLDASKPAVISALSSSDYKYLLMPVRVS